MACGRSLARGDRAGAAAAAVAGLTPCYLPHPMSARGEFRISITKEDLVFAAAHFITFAGHRCETLHGHNYRAAVELGGSLEPDSWYVVDFSAVKQIMRQLTGELDHKVLLPTGNPIVRVTKDADRVSVAVSGAPRYVFPARDCVLL